MPGKKSRASGFSYVPLVFISVLLLLWVAGVIRIQVSPEVTIPLLFFNPFDLVYNRFHSR